jgi:hypothetical protein
MSDPSAELGAVSKMRHEEPTTNCVVSSDLTWAGIFSKARKTLKCNREKSVPI